MKEFEYVVKDAEGLHARPATLIVKLAKQYKSVVTLYANEKQANCLSILQIMKLAAKQGQTVRITIDGEDEDEALVAFQDFCNREF